MLHPYTRRDCCCFGLTFLQRLHGLLLNCCSPWCQGHVIHEQKFYELPQNPQTTSRRSFRIWPNRWNVRIPDQFKQRTNMVTKSTGGAAGLRSEVGIQEEFLSQPCYRHNFLKFKSELFCFGLFCPFAKKFKRFLHYPLRFPLRNLGEISGGSGARCLHNCQRSRFDPVRAFSHARSRTRQHHFPTFKSTQWESSQCQKLC